MVAFGGAAAAFDERVFIEKTWQPFELPEPPEGVRWTREDWALLAMGESVIK